MNSIWKQMPMDIVCNCILPLIVQPQNKELLYDIRNYSETKTTYTLLTGIRHISEWGALSPYDRTTIINDYLQYLITIDDYTDNYNDL
jgi:hypothetical protein